MKNNKTTDSSKTPKLLYFVAEDWYFCSHRLPLASAAKNAGYEVVVATKPGDYQDVIENAGFRVIPVNSNRRSLNPLKMFGTIMSLIAIYRKEKPDIVHHIALKTILLGSIAARVCRIKNVVNTITGLGWLYSSKSRKARFLKPLVTKVLAVLLRKNFNIVQNPDDLEWLKNMGVNESAISVVRGSGVNTEIYRPGEALNPEPVIVLLGRMLVDKGIYEFVDAATSINRDSKKARFVLAGNPDENNPASIPEDKLMQWQREGYVEWIGHQDNVAELLNKTDIVCLPSYREGLPLSLLEAASSGLPIVTTDVPGCREIVLDGVNGFLVPSHDSKLLATALLRLIDSSELRMQMGLNGRELVIKHFSIEKINQQTLELYSQVSAASGNLYAGNK